MAVSFALEIDPFSSRNGWMDCWLVVDGKRHALDATSVFPPFGSVLAFTRAVAENRLPHKFLWDEEGHGAQFEALPVPGRVDMFRLRIDHDGEIVVDDEFNRMEIVRQVLEALRRVALDCPGAESEWDLPYFLIEDFERGLAQGFESPFRGAHTGITHFVFNHYQDGNPPTFSIWVDRDPAFDLPMDDIARHWHAWFGLLENILHGALPAEVTFQHEAQEGPGLFSFLGMDVVFQFQAEPLAQRDHFRLKIILRHPSIKPQIDTLLFEQILERRQFVAMFVETFQQFLKTDYLAFLESDANHFDLRSLPIDRLIH